MFTIPYNTTLFLAVILVGAIVGFLIYGSIVGFENTFREPGTPKDEH